MVVLSERRTLTPPDDLAPLVQLAVNADAAGPGATKPSQFTDDPGRVRSICERLETHVG